MLAVEARNLKLNKFDGVEKNNAQGLLVLPLRQGPLPVLGDRERRAS
jgi:hypothetical protein